MRILYLYIQSVDTHTIWSFYQDKPKSTVVIYNHCHNWNFCRIKRTEPTRHTFREANVIWKERKEFKSAERIGPYEIALLICRTKFGSEYVQFMEENVDFSVTNVTFFHYYLNWTRAVMSRSI